MIVDIIGSFHKLYPMEDPVDYEPRRPTRSPAGRRRPGYARSSWHWDLLVERDGNQLLYMP